ncbi:MAG: ABC transporter ATP-binding protein [Spirochaetota bacterium]
MRSGNPVLEVTDLVKTYGNLRAVDSLSLQVPEGSIFGLLGPNGAGKTTTLECVEGLLPYDSGKIRIAGMDPAHAGKELYQHIGVQLQRSGIPPVMTCAEAVKLFSASHACSPDLSILERFGLQEKMHASYETLSVGQKRRLSLALAFIHRPEVLLLDEPTAGLDVESRLELHRLITEFRREGRTVILATHDMAEAEKLCDTLAIIIRGRLAVSGSPTVVTAAGDRRTTISISTIKNTVLETLPRLRGCSAPEVEDTYVRYSTEDPREAVTELLDFITQRQDELIDLRVERPSLEQRFIEIIQDKEHAR